MPPAPATLPDEALHALRQGQREEAIRTLRQQGQDPSTATQTVDAAINSDPWLRKQCAAAAARSGRGGRIITWVLVIIAAAVAWIRFGPRI